MHLHDAVGGGWRRDARALLGNLALTTLLSISFPLAENAILAFGNGTYLNAAVAPSIPPTTQMYKQERNANRAVATLRENIFEHLQPTKVGEG